MFVVFVAAIAVRDDTRFVKKCNDRLLSITFNYYQILACPCIVEFKNTLQTHYINSEGLVICACVRACMHACVRACVREW